MSKYATDSQEILMRNGKLVGFNAGYGFWAEHGYGYKGEEQSKSSTEDRNAEGPFYADIVTNPEAVHIMEFSDGTVWITNNDYSYFSLQSKSEEERREFIEKRFINDSDRKIDESVAQKYGKKVPEVIAFWDGVHDNGGFDLISTTEQSSELLKKLYEEMQKQNIAISSDYSFMFKDRGLSFVLMDQLTEQDIEMKQVVDYLAEMTQKFEKEYTEFLIQKGLIDERGKALWSHPIYASDPRIIDFQKDSNGGLNPIFHMSLSDNSKSWAYKIQKSRIEKGEELLNMHRIELQHLAPKEKETPTIPSIPFRLTGDEITALTDIITSQEFIEYAENSQTEEIGQYLLEQLTKYRESRETQESQYAINEDSLEAIADEQRADSVNKQTKTLNDKMLEWLHPSRKIDREKQE